MQPESKLITRRSQSILTTNTVLRKTYSLLACTLVFSALAAAFSMHIQMPFMNPFLMILLYFGLLFLTTSLRNNPVAGVVAVFALTGFLGLTLGPLLEYHIKSVPNGQQLIITALGGTGVIFFALSAYALTTKKDFSYLGGYIMVGLIAALLLGVAAMLFHMTFLSLIISGAFILLSSALILYKTSEIVNGGETNYIMATVTLYVALFNIFVNLLRILSVFSGNRN
ncbi:MAG: Bax inhibitor-1/YccA family protein [Gammaproteobacteria bacterium]|nr:Bax inhibitor-1/YccA family protein [Gammaproteobacteria bacterium]